jgi:hypothetical protein
VQVDPEGVDPALHRDQLGVAGVAEAGQRGLQVALDDGDRAAGHGPAGRLRAAAGPVAGLLHLAQHPPAPLRRPGADLLHEQVVQGPVEDVAVVPGLGLGDRLLEQGDALVVAVLGVGQGRCPC